MPTILAGVALAISYQSKLAPAWTWTMSLKESPLGPYALSLCLVSVWESPCGHFYNTALKTDNLKTNYYNIGCSLTNKSSTPENLILVELLQFRSNSRMFLLF